tara:strand:+ start:146 stop:382 length:237 start_codon:yes stop_codon:yes gene_type:complete
MNELMEEWDEVISHFAKRGDVDTINKITEIMKILTEEYYNRIDDPDYSTEESISSEDEMEYDDEIISVKMDGDFFYCE